MESIGSEEKLFYLDYFPYDLLRIFFKYIHIKYTIYVYTYTFYYPHIYLLHLNPEK